MHEELIREYGSLVTTIAGSICKGAYVEREDMMQAGMLGLLESCRKYDSDHAGTFSTFASKRIRGEMIDEMRRSDWVSRSAAKDYREGGKDVNQFVTMEPWVADIVSEHDWETEVSAEQKAALHTAMKNLSGQQLAVAWLYSSPGMSLREIGEAMGFSERRAGQIFGSAVKKLREVLHV